MYFSRVKHILERLNQTHAPSTEMIPLNFQANKIWSSGREMKKDSHLFMYKT